MRGWTCHDCALPELDWLLNLDERLMRSPGRAPSKPRAGAQSRSTRFTRRVQFGLLGVRVQSRRQKARCGSQKGDYFKPGPAARAVVETLALVGALLHRT